MSEKLSKILSITSTVFVVILVIFAAVVSFMLGSANKQDDVPSAFGLSAFAIQTDSMEDEIMTGDLIISKKCDASQLNVDDIITFYSIDEKNNPFINTHRIVEKLETETGMLYVTKGDNKETNDTRRVQEGDVIALYTGFRIPLLGYVLTYLGTQMGFFLCIVLPILLYTIWQIYKLIVVVMHNQKVKMINEVNEQTSDAIKEAVIAEYLAKQEEEKRKNNAE